MGVSLSEQARCFLASLLLGFILSLLYDLLRAVRLRRATKRRFTSALDLLYCAAFALLTFLFALRIGGGELRLYMLCSALFGAVSYFTLCARLFRPPWAFWAEVLCSLALFGAAARRWGPGPQGSGTREGWLRCRGWGSSTRRRRRRR